MKKERGQLTVFFALILPILLGLLAVVINFGVLVHEKIRLQIAADRAVFAGSAKLAYLMNEISKENWRIHKSFLKVFNNFGPNSQQSVEECNKRIVEMRRSQWGTITSTIEDILATGYSQANEVANNVALESFSGVAYEALFGRSEDRLFHVRTEGDVKRPLDDEDDEMLKDVICGNISGLVFDPNDVESQSNRDLLKYVYSNKNYVGLIIRLTTSFVAPVAGNLFAPIELSAVAAGQPYGGSIKRFALLANETKTVEEAVTLALKKIDEGAPLWFRYALVPVLLAEGMGGMNIDNEDIYLQ